MGTDATWRVENESGAIAASEARRFESAAFKQEPGERAVQVSELQPGDFIKIGTEMMKVTDKARLEPLLRDRDRILSEMQDAGKGKGEVDRAKMLQSLRELDAILTAFPPDVRGKAGGFAKLASLKTDAARVKEYRFMGLAYQSIGCCLAMLSKISRRRCFGALRNLSSGIHFPLIPPQNR